jgi:hypothetical protein
MRAYCRSASLLAGKRHPESRPGEERCWEVAHPRVISEVFNNYIVKLTGSDIRPRTYNSLGPLGQCISDPCHVKPQAQDLIATVRCSIHFRLRPAHVALWRFSRDTQIRHYAPAIFW